MNKIYSVIFKIIKDDISDEEKNELIDKIREISVLDDLLPCLVANKLTNLFYYKMMELEIIELLGKFTFRMLNQIVTFSTLKNQEYEEEFRNFSAQFVENNIDYAVIKGFHLTNSLYGKPRGFIVRDYYDIDILVNKKDISKINKILANNGYIQGNLNLKTMMIEPCTRTEKIDMIINTHQQYQHIKESKYCRTSPCNINLIDINFTIFEGGNIKDYINIERMLNERVLRKAQSGIEYYSLRSEHDLIQLCYHLYKDTRYEIKKKSKESLRLINFYDIYKYIKFERDNIDWDFMYEEIHNAKIQNQMYYVLKLLSMIFTDININDFVEMLGKHVNSEIHENIKDGYERILNQSFN